MRQIVIDLDHTICVPRITEEDCWIRYGEAVPLHLQLDAIRRLHAQGDRIVLFTARRMLRHNGDLTRVLADVEAPTIAWLEKHRVPYDQLLFGKPYGDHYVDDRSLLPGQLLTL